MVRPMSHERTLLDLLTDTTQLHTAYVNRMLSRWGIHSGQGSIISALGILGPCSQKDLAEFRQVSPATISVMLGRMEAKGLIARTPSDEGGKRNQISLTEKGMQIADEMAATMPAENAKIFEGLTEEDMETAARIFLIIRDNLAN